MIETVIRSTVDLNRGVQRTVLRDVFAEQDDQAHTIEIAVTRNGVPVSIDGGSVAAYFVRARDNATVLAGGSVLDGKVVVTLPGACYSQAGSFSVAVRLTLGDQTHTVFYGTGSVLLTLTETIVDPANVIPSLDDLLAQIDRMEAGTEAAQAAAQTAEASAENADMAAQTAAQAAQEAMEKAGLADTAAQGAVASAGQADAAADQANAAAASIEGMTVSESVVEYGAGVSASVTRDPESGALHVAIQTERGPQGPSYTIKGPAYATVEALEAAVTAPAVGDQYNVGAAAPYDVYRWTGSGWENQGKVQGPAGTDGEDGMTPVLSVGEVTTLPPGSAATVEIDGPPEAPVLHFGIPKGETDGVLSVAGVSPDEDGDVPLTAADVGALAATGSGALVQTGRVELIVPTEGWTQNAQGWYERMVTCAGTVAGSQTQRVDAAVQGAQIGNVLLAGLRVDADDTLTMVCLAQPAEAFTLLALISEVV